MKTRRRAEEPSARASRSRRRKIRLALSFALITSTLLLANCGGDGHSSAPVVNVPLVWDQAQAVWDNVNWQ